MNQLQRTATLKRDKVMNTYNCIQELDSKYNFKTYQIQSDTEQGAMYQVFKLTGNTCHYAIRSTPTSDRLDHIIYLEA